MLLLGLWLLCSILQAGEAHILRLGSEGCATVVVADSSRTAFLTDGGRRSGGITDAVIGGTTVLNFLSDRKIDHLVVTCSHPHDDHLSSMRVRQLN